MRPWLKDNYEMGIWVTSVKQMQISQRTGHIIRTKSKDINISSWQIHPTYNITVTRHIQSHILSEWMTEWNSEQVND